MAKIEELLGAELFAQVQAALKGKGEGGRDVTLVVGSDGSYIPKEKFDHQGEKLKAAERLAETAQRALDELKAAGDPARLAGELDKAKGEVAALKASYEKQLAEQELDFTVRGMLTDAQDAALVAGLLDKDKLKLKDGQVQGLDEQVRALRESKPFLFAPRDDGRGLTGLKPADGSGSPVGGGDELTQVLQFMGL